MLPTPSAKDWSRVSSCPGRTALFVIAVLASIFSTTRASANWFFEQKLSDFPVEQIAARGIVVDASDRVHIAWHSGWSVYYQRSDTLGSWTTPTQIGGGQKPQIARDPFGDVHVVWTDYSYVHHRQWNGSDWSEDRVVSGDATSVDNPAVVSDLFGNLHVVWQDARLGTWEIYQATWNGVSWSAPSPLTQDPNPSYDPDIASDLGGNLHLVWQDNRDGNWEIYYKRWDGVSWGADERLTVDAYESTAPTVSCDPATAVHVAWQDQRSGTWEIYYKHGLEDGQWESDEQLTFSQPWPGAQYPCIVSDSEGRTHVSWQDYRNYDWEIYYARRADGVWEPEQRLTRSGGESLYPALGVGPEGDLHLVWDDRRAGGEVFYRANKAVPPPVITWSFPTMAHADDPVAVRVRGDGFLQPDSVWLSDPSYGRLIGGAAPTASDELLCSFDLTDAAPGHRDLVLQNPDGQRATAPPGFEVTPAIPWSGDWKISNGTSHSYDPAIAIDRTGNAHVVWEDNRYGPSEILYRKWDGLTWGPEERLTNSPGSWGAGVAIDAADRPHVFWSGYFNGWYQIFHTAWTGSAWSEAEQLSDLGTNAFQVGCCSDPDGVINIVWTDTSQGQRQVFHRSFDGAWSSPEQISFGYEAYSPRIACDDAGQRHVVWQDQRYGYYQTFYRRFDGMTWLDEVPMELGYNTADRPSVSPTGDGGVLVVCHDTREGYPRIFGRFWTGTEWTPVQRISGPNSIAEVPALALSPDGILTMAWTDRRDGNYEIYYRRASGTAWTAERRLTNAYGDSYRPSLAVTANGDIHVVWRDQREGSFRIFHNRRGEPITPELIGISPGSAWDFGTHDLTVTGRNFLPPVQLRLDGPGGVSRSGTILESSYTAATARFDLTGVPLGSWSMVLTTADGQQDALDGAFVTVPSPWSPELRLTEDPASSSLAFNNGRSMVWDPLGTLHLVWFDTRDGNQEIYWKNEFHGGWSTDQRLTNNFAASAYPVVAAVPNGDLLVCWQDARDGNLEIYAKRRHDEAWLADMRLTSNSYPSAYPSLAADPSGNVHAVWQDGRHGNWEIYYRKWNGVDWEPEQRLTSNAGSSQFPSIVADAIGRLHVVWMDARNQSWDIYSRTFDGATWSPETGLVLDPAGSYYPSLAADRFGLVYVVWQDDRDGNLEVYGQRLDQADGPHRLTEDSVDSSDPMAAISEDRKVHVCWTNWSQEIGQVYMRSFDGQIWSVADRVSDSAVGAALSSITAGPANSLAMAWRDGRDGNLEIYARERREDAASSAEEEVVAQGLGLLVRPNPFRERLEFLIRGVGGSEPRLGIYDLLGRLLCTMRPVPVSGVGHQVLWDGRDGAGRRVPAGVYFYRLSCGERRLQGSVTRVR